MFGFMLDETDSTRDARGSALSCKTCHLRLAPRAPRVVIEATAHHRDCYEAAYRKRTGRRPTLVPASHGDRLTYRPAA
jgi:hypothetical protein